MSFDKTDYTDKFISEDYKPHAEPIGKVYEKAMAELVDPAPAIHLRRFPKLDTMTGGLREREFTILCGSTGTGKTTLCANLSRDLMQQKIPHFVASVETGATDFVKRQISAVANRDWNSGDAVPVELLKHFHTEYGTDFQNEHAWLSLYDDRFPVETLMGDLAYMVKYNGVKVAIIDNLNFFMEVTSAKDAVTEMDRVIHNLIVFCKQVPVHVIMVMHPKKTDGGRVESEFDIKGSSTAVQEAHNVLLFNRPHPDLIQANVAAPGDREILIAKMRRKGKYVRRRLILRAADGVTYHEGDIV